ncbi:hypothetical protein ES703_108327 [subsurface metagenome]
MSSDRGSIRTLVIIFFFLILLVTVPSSIPTAFVRFSKNRLEAALTLFTTLITFSKSFALILVSLGSKPLSVVGL